MNYRMEIQYDGTRYHGWQRLDKFETIQGKIEDVLSRLFGHKIEIHGAGRTDAGVHAKGQVANFKVNCVKKEKEILEYLNKYLPEDIRITKICNENDMFHSRLNAKGKVYRYRILNSKIADVFSRKYVHQVSENLDVEEMKRASAFFVGKHNFKAFCSNKHFKKSAVREIYSINIEEFGDELMMTFSGNGFLYNMVRIIVGTLIEVGLGKRKAEEIPEIILSQNREMAGETAPAKGLCLIRVDY
jgi:tRNA pseudouridine38-40 synthase